MNIKEELLLHEKVCKLAKMYLIKSVERRIKIDYSNSYLIRMFALKSSTTQIFFILLLQSDNELPMSKMQKNWGVTDFVFQIKRVKKYPNFDKSVLVTRHGLSGC